MDTLAGGPSGAVAVSEPLSDTSAVLSGDPSGAVAVSETLSDTSAVLAGGADTGVDTLAGGPSGAVAVSEPLSDTSAVLSGDPSGAVHLSDTSAGAGVVLDPLTIAVELVRNDRQVAGSSIAAAMRRHGHTVTDRTGLRWRGRAVDHLDAELNKDLSDASNDEVRLALTTV